MNPNVAHLGHQNYDIRQRIIGVTLAAGALLLPAACAAENDNAPSDPTPSVSQPLEATPPVDMPSASPEVEETGTYEEFLTKIHNASPEETGDVFVISQEDLTLRDVTAFDSMLGFGSRAGEEFNPDTTPYYMPEETEIRVLNAFGDEIVKFANTNLPRDVAPDVRAGLVMQVGVIIYDSFQTVGGDNGHEVNINTLTSSSMNAEMWEAPHGRQLTESELENMYHAVRTEVFDLPRDPGDFAVQKAPDEEAPQASGLGLNIIKTSISASGDRSISIPIQGERYDCDDFLGAKIIEGDWCTDTDLKLFAAVEDNLDQIVEQSGVDPGSAALIAFYGLRAIQNNTAEGYDAQDMRFDIVNTTSFAVSDADIHAVEETLGTSAQQS